MALNEREILDRLRDAVVALKEVRAQRDTLLQQKSEPIAIIGMACRFPGNADTPESFFDLLTRGVDTVTAIPTERWAFDARNDADPRLQGARWGAFTKDIDLFDAAFFGISPREAERLDPQQRFLLELTWEALERAGIVPATLAGTKSGVFVGILNTDYYYMNLAVPRENQDAYTATGNGHCFAAGRLAYTFGLQGPAVSVDTACSSSLVATHAACNSLRSQECDVAVVCGTNLMLHPFTAELIAKTGALAPDGRCKSFDALANGYVRGEGCGVLILKRLSDAQLHGDPIIAVIRGSAVNQDGRSTGLTTPNVLAQEAMLEQALANAQLKAEDLGYIEAHGTGTPLGDPIEMDALRSVFGKKRTNGMRCWIGSVKTNIGHLEAAAGIAGLIKTAMAMGQEKIPPNLHFKSLNPRISLLGTDMAVVTEMVRWPRNENRRRAGVSSFGMSGTNCHVILEEAPLPPAASNPVERSAYLLPISAKNSEALSATIKSYADFLTGNSSLPLADIVHTASVRRTAHNHRAAFVAQSNEEFCRLLTSYSAEHPGAGTVTGQVRETTAPKVIFVFPGQGSQWLGMGRELLAEERVFHESMDRSDRLIRAEAGFSVLEELNADESKSRLGEIDVIQPVLFAFEVALAALWQSWGVMPDCVVGHSMGEVAAAHVAGMLTLEDAVKVICRRSRLMRRLSGQGAMALVELPMTEAEAAVAHHSAKLSAAVSNGPRTSVLSGDPEALDQVIAELEGRRVFCRRVKVDVASHSPQVDVLHNELVEALQDLHPVNGNTVMISTVTGKLVHGEHLSARYWWNNLRQPVRFHQVTHEMLQDRSTIFVELSPHPILLSALEETIRDAPFGAIAVASLARQTPHRRVLLESLAKMWAHGFGVDWRRVAPEGRHIVAAPTYPWQRKRYWIDIGETREIIAPEKGVSTPALSPAPAFSIDDCLFKQNWQLSPLQPPTSSTSHQNGKWLIFMDSGRIGKNVLVRLRSRGATCIRVDNDRTFTKQSAHDYKVDFADPNQLARLLDDVFTNQGGLTGIIYLGCLDAPSWEDTTVDTLRSFQEGVFLGTLYLTQALVRAQPDKFPKLWFVTQGAIAVKPDDENRSVAQSALWGFARTMMLEHPELRCTCIDLDGTIRFDTITTLVQQFEYADDEEHIAFRSDGRWVGRFTRAQVADAPPVDFKLKPDASYLITGGLGGLGLSVAKWMIGAGARHVALMGRKGPTEEAAKILRDMEKGGAKVKHLSCDVSDPNDVLSALCLFGAEWPELRGIVHTAGVLDDRTIMELSSPNIQTVFGPKVFGAWNLHSLTSTQELDFFVLYSSGASLLGSSGQANYSAGNAFLDALAHARQCRGMRGMSIQWGAFLDVGLAAKHDNRGSRLERLGLAGFSTDDGIGILQKLLERPRPAIGALRLDVAKWLEGFPELRSRNLWSILAETSKQNPVAPQAMKAIADTPVADLMTQLNETSASERSKLLQEHVRRQFAHVMRMQPTAIDVHETIQHYGVDSLMAIELRNRLQTSLKIQFSVTEIWTHGTVAQLATWLGNKLTGSAQETVSTKTSEASTPTNPVRSAGSAGQWVVIPRPVPNASMRLFCFPYAGGGAPVYSSWSDKLPDDIEVCAIQPPGRHARASEPLLQRVEDMVAEIVPALLKYLDRPFAMFGHCLGAIVMFEVVRIIQSKYRLAPIHLFVSGAPNPSQYLVPSVTIRPDAEFLELLRAIGLAEKSVLEDADVVQTMLPMVRADFAAASKYRYNSGKPLDLPITTFSATADVFAPPNAVHGWRNETNAHVSHHIYPGGHYFLVPERDPLLKIIVGEMRHRVAALQQSKSSTDPMRWFIDGSPKSKPRLRLICFPGIGGTADDFQRLLPIIPQDSDVCAIELPGHGRRKNEAPLGLVEDIVQHVFPAIKKALGTPMVFLAQDLGALVMYEVVLRLQAENGPLPKGLIVIGAMAPDAHYFAPIHHFEPSIFTATLRLYNALWDSATETGALRADFAAFANYENKQRVAFDIPIFALAGQVDQFVPAAAIHAWRQYTTGSFEQHLLPCDHVSVITNTQTTAILRAVLQKMIGK